jgi:hypothetical protein
MNIWIKLSDAFLSVVRKDCAPGQLLVHARREGDIERGIVERDTCADYLYRAKISEEKVAEVMRREVLSISYGNFEDSVRDRALHDAYLTCWHAMARTQDPPPYSERRRIFPPDIFDDQPSKKSVARRKGGT